MNRLSATSRYGNCDVLITITWSTDSNALRELEILPLGVEVKISSTGSLFKPSLLYLNILILLKL